MKNICENCKYWKPLKKEDYFITIDSATEKWKGCEEHINYKNQIDRANLLKEYGKCTHPKISYSAIPNENIDELIYMDGEEYFAYCYMGKNFGCVYFKERE